MFEIEPPALLIPCLWLLFNVAWTWYIFVHQIWEQQRLTIRSLLILTFQTAVAMSLAVAVSR